MPPTWRGSESFPFRIELGMRFKIDENLPVEIADLLQQEGHEATTVTAERLTGSTDAVLARVCSQENRALITFDTDFGDIRSYPPQAFPGLVLLRLRKQDKTHVLSIFPRLIQMFSAQPLAGTLWIVEEGRIRIRE